jgi:FKBP-type peptidyl-prolyl cis-trans isomerase FklB
MNMMKNGVKLVLALSLGTVLLSLTAKAEDKPAAPAAPKEKPKDPNEQKEQVSYAVGMTFANQIKRAGFEIDVDTVAAAMRDVLAGHEPKMNEKEQREVLSAYQKEVSAKREEERKKMAEKNKKEGAEFLAANKKKEAIQVHEAKLPDGSMAELQYKIITAGTGAIPKSNDMVSVNYRGTLINGTEFDSSAKRGQPGKFNVSRVVKGWTEALQMMKVGSKWQLFLPSTLGYGDYGAGPNSPIEPGSTLIFDVELVSIDTPPPAPTPAPSQPLTSDIIRVPSAEELKKGAKIEVLKPEEAAKLAQEEAAKKAKEENKPK